MMNVHIYSGGSKKSHPSVHSDRSKARTKSGTESGNKPNSQHGAGLERSPESSHNGKSGNNSGAPNSAKNPPSCLTRSADVPAGASKSVSDRIAELADALTKRSSISNQAPSVSQKSSSSGKDAESKLRSQHSKTGQELSQTRSEDKTSVHSRHTCNKSGSTQRCQGSQKGSTSLSMAGDLHCSHKPSLCCKHVCSCTRRTSANPAHQGKGETSSQPQADIPKSDVSLRGHNIGIGTFSAAQSRAGNQTAGPHLHKEQSSFVPPPGAGSGSAAPLCPSTNLAMNDLPPPSVPGTVGYSASFTYQWNDGANTGTSTTVWKGHF